MVHLLTSSPNVNTFLDIKKSLKILSLIHASCQILTSFSEDHRVAGCDAMQPVTNLPAFRKNVLSPFLGQQVPRTNKYTKFVYTHQHMLTV